MCGVGALVTLELPDDSPVLDLPWIITFGPLNDDEDWEPVVCGPYERAHAMAIDEEPRTSDAMMALMFMTVSFDFRLLRAGIMQRRCHL